MKRFDDRVQQAVDEAERFIGKAITYLMKSEDDSLAIYGCVEAAAMKRASMDLTRSLVDVRKPRH